ncbi:hypothetical protein [Chitinophaga sp.]|uniref:hypothetical protein n=1 Tax=Chitinophaga sp. TaxID=1869181 RepID=UPI002F934E01
MSESAVLKKLYFHKAATALIINAPAEYITLIGEVAYDTKPKKHVAYDFVQVFAIQQSDLGKLVKVHVASGKPDCIFWACYPKGTGSIKSDIKRETVWIAFEAAGLEAVTSVSIDDTWTALRARPINR